MPFPQRENISAYIDGSRAAGVEDNNNFMTIDLFEAKNLGQVALNIVTLKRKTGHGMEKSTPAAPGGSFAGAGSGAAVVLATDQSSKSDVALPAAPVELKSDDVKRLVQLFCCLILFCSRFAFVSFRFRLFSLRFRFRFRFVVVSSRVSRVKRRARVAALVSLIWPASRPSTSTRACSSVTSVRSRFPAAASTPSRFSGIRK